MAPILKTHSRRKLALKKRDLYGIDAKEHIDIKMLISSATKLVKLAKVLKKKARYNQYNAKKVKRVVAAIRGALIETLETGVDSEELVHEKMQGKRKRMSFI